MASRETDNGAASGPVNDSIDELLDGLPAEPMLPKKRARPIDAVVDSSAENRRADDKVIVTEGTDPRLLARRDAERERRASSTFGTSFLEPNLNWQKIVVGVGMMLTVLGIYAFVRHLKKDDAALHTQNMQNTPNSTTPIATASVMATTQLAAETTPPPPSASAPAASDPKPLASTTTAHHLPLHTHSTSNQHAPTTPAASVNVDNLFKPTR